MIFIDEDGTYKKKTRARPHGAQEYLGNGKHEWEHVTTAPGGGDTARLRVPGGWLYAHEGANDGAMCFVPVPEVVGYAV